MEGAEGPSKMHNQSLAFYMDVGDEHMASPTRQLAAAGRRDILDSNDISTSKKAEDGDIPGKQHSPHKKSPTVYKEESIQMRGRDTASPDENDKNDNNNDANIDALFAGDYDGRPSSDMAIRQEEDTMEKDKGYNGHTPDNYTPYDNADYRYGIPDDFSDDDTNNNHEDDDDGFGAYASILNEDSVLDEASLHSETPHDMRNPRERVRAARRKAGGSNSHPKKTQEHIQGRYVTSHIGEGSITSMVGQENKLDRRTMEIQLSDAQKKLSRALKEISMLRGKMGNSGITRQMDKCKSIMHKQALHIKELTKNKKGLERVVRSQAKMLEGKNIHGDGDKIWSEEAQVKILMERVRQLQRQNMELRERDKVVVGQNENMRSYTETLKIKLHTAQLTLQNARKRGLVKGEDQAAADTTVLDMMESPEKQEQKHTTTHHHIKELTTKVHSMTLAVEKVGKEKVALQRLLKSHTTRLENEKLTLLRDLQASHDVVAVLKESMSARDREARMHLLTVKKLKQTCKDLQSGNKKLEQASVIYTSGLALENSTYTQNSTYTLAGPGGSHVSGPAPPSNSNPKGTPRSGRGVSSSVASVDTLGADVSSSTFMTSS
jgi:hypothetical protein